MDEDDQPPQVEPHAELGPDSSGAIAQGEGAQAAGERAVIAADNSGMIITGDVTLIVPDDDAAAPDAPVMLAWLQQVREAYLARGARVAPEDQLDAALQRLDHAAELLKGEVAHADAFDALRVLLATGIARWDGYPRAPSIPTEAVIAYLVPSLLREALWQLVIAPRLPDGWMAALGAMASPAVMTWVNNMRAIRRNDPPRHRRALYQLLAGDSWRDACQHLLDDLSDPQRGAPAVEDMLAVRAGKRAPVQDRKSLLLAVLGFAATAVAAGIIGNNADRLVLQLLEWLRKTLDSSVAPAKASTQDAGTQQPAQPSLKHYDERLARMALCLVPAGPFWMGTPESDKQASDDEKPLHKVDIGYDYWIGRFPVTVAELSAFVQATGYRTVAEREGAEYTWQHPLGRNSDVRGKPNHPVREVSWHDAIAFCDWLCRVSGRQVGLPSEAEWEKAARGGLTIPPAGIFCQLQQLDAPIANRQSPISNLKLVRLYPWGDELPDRTRANLWDHEKDTTPVGKYSPRGDSPCGCCDMAGNVWEWTRSLWGKDLSKSDYKYPYDPNDRRREDLQASDDIRRVLRGGSWDLNQDFARCACRLWFYPDVRYDYIGFRVVVRLAPVPTSAL
jgi:formylglycine-generating enzyme required for sulfatase activity